MSRIPHPIILLLIFLLGAGCFLGPQPEPPDMNEVDDGSREESDADADADGDADGWTDDYCDPSDLHDDDGDGVWDCGNAEPGEDGGGGDCDPDIDDPTPPDGDEEEVIPGQDEAQWPIDPADVFDSDDSDGYVVVDY